MTEQEWLAATDPDRILDYHRVKKSPRRLRLLAVACVRSAVGADDPLCRQVSDVAELYADGAATRAEFLAARKAVRRTARATCPHVGLLGHPCGLTDDAMEGLTMAIHNARHGRGRAGKLAECALIRDVFGNPFRPVSFTPAWRSEAVVGLAAGIYGDRAFERLPILADALEEAGCEHPDILTHCREPGVHVRGCWVVDLVLGKE